MLSRAHVRQVVRRWKLAPFNNWFMTKEWISHCYLYVPHMASVHQYRLVLDEGQESIDKKFIYPPRAQRLSLCQLPRYILTTGWSAGPWIQQPAAFAWGPGGRRRPRLAPCQCGTEALPVVAVSSTQKPAPDGPSPLTPEAFRPPWYTAGKPQGWPASHSPGAVKPQGGKGS